MKFRIIYIFIVLIISAFAFNNLLIDRKNTSKINIGGINEQLRNIHEQIFDNKLEIEKIYINSDKDQDDILDLEDFLVGARNEVSNKPLYKDAYYSGGYPPESEGVCTDLIWRSLLEGGYNLKEMVDIDIKNYLEDYPRIRGERPDSNIDFRRVPNLVSYFNKYATTLTIDVIPKDIENLKEWQGGDIVVFDSPYDHIAIVSDIRNSEGVPYILHNSGPYAREEDKLLYWHNNISKITHHFRFPKIE